MALEDLAGAQTSASEPQVKAAFLLNFPKYVDWPSEAFAATNSPIIFAVLYDNEVATELRRMSAGKVINGRPVEFKLLTSEQECDQRLHILFVGPSGQRPVSDVLGRVQKASVLTVGESDDFLDKGGVINFTRRDRNVRVQVNLEAASLARLKISSKLLSVADAVKGGAPK
jgi:YfiR/HmsC-like